MTLLLLMATQAHASAYFFLDSNTRAIGRGGANVAGADDLSGQYYNPAALINLDRGQFHLDVWAVNQSITFERATEAGTDGAMGTGDDQNFDPVSNEAPPMIEPSLAFGAPLGGLSPALKNTVLAIGIYYPTAPTLSYPEDGAQRYSLTSATVWSGYAGPSIAQRFAPWLSVGAGLQYSFLRVDESLAGTSTIVGGYNNEGPDVPDNDITIDIRTWDKFALGWNAGVLVQPLSWLDVAASIQAPIHFEAQGSLTTTFNQDHIFLGQLASDSFTDDTVSLDLTLPMTLRGGVQVHPNDKCRIELDGVWTNWKEMQELPVNLSTGDGDPVLTLVHDPESPLLTQDLEVSSLPPLPTGFTNAFSVRLGGDYEVAKMVTLRGGAHYETSAVPTAWRSVSVVDGPKIGVGLGATFNLGKHVAIDASVAEQVIFPHTVTDSEVRSQVVTAEVVEPFATYTETGKVVGNGDYKSNTTFAGLGATFYFGAPKTGAASN